MSLSVVSHSRESSLERPTVHGSTFKMFALCFCHHIHAFRRNNLLKNKPFDYILHQYKRQLIQFYRGDVENPVKQTTLDTVFSKGSHILLDKGHWHYIFQTKHLMHCLIKKRGYFKQIACQNYNFPCVLS